MNEKIYESNEIVGYYKGKAIVKQDDGVLFYEEIPEEFVTIGEIAFPEDISPISELPEAERKEIIAKFGDVII